MKLDRSFYTREVLIVAEEMLGKTLVHVTPEGVTKGIIVEVEAYRGPEDKAAHTYNNRITERTKIQFGNGGYAYIYLIYGMHYCMNVVVNTEYVPQSILVRALKPVDGIELMKKRRKISNEKLLCNGPGKLCQAMGITKGDYGEDLCGDKLYLEDCSNSENVNCNIGFVIEKSKRINIDYAEEYKDCLWRFTVKNSKFISKL